MKNNWVRLIAGALASVVLVRAIALTGGMKKGSRTDGLLYQASGIHPDAELLLIDRQTVTAEEYLYWLAYDCEYLSTYVPDVDWSAELTEGLSYGDYAKTDTLETVKLYSVVRAWAEEAGVTLTEEDQAALDAQRLEYVAGQEGIDLTPEGAALLARLADGGLRDALSLLDQCSGGGQPVDEQLSLIHISEPTRH